MHAAVYIPLDLRRQRWEIDSVPADGHQGLRFIPFYIVFVSFIRLFKWIILLKYRQPVSSNCPSIR